MKSYLIPCTIAAALAVTLVGSIAQNAFADGAIAADGSNSGSATADFAPLGEHSITG